MQQGASSLLVVNQSVNRSNAITCTCTQQIETEVEKVKRCLYAPSTPLDSPSFLKVVNMLFKKNIAVPNDFKELLFTAPYTSASQATSSSPATTSATTVLKTVQLVLKKTMKELHSKEACGIPLLGVFVAHLALTLTDTTKLSFLADMEFSVVRHKMQRGTKPASDAALVVALVHQVKPVLLFEYKPVVDTRKAMVKRNDLLEVVLQGFYGLYQHNVPTLLHCLTDLSQWYYFKLDKEEPSKMKIARFHSIQEEELNLQTHCSFLGPVFTNDILPRQGLT